MVEMNYESNQDLKNLIKWLESTGPDEKPDEIRDLLKEAINIGINLVECIKKIRGQQSYEERVQLLKEIIEDKKREIEEKN
ncbi:MAG: hypothetical protein ACE5F2_01780 [Candidatus Paceibacteria bacterium]